MSLASNLSVYQQKLEQRANIARQILSDPIDDLDCEIRVVEQLEKDLAVFKEKVPQPPSPEEIAEVEDKLHQAEQLQKTNSLRSQVLEKRRVFLEGEEKQINAEMKQYQALQEEENQKSVVDNDNNLTNAVSEENDASKEYIRQLQLKKEEHLRKRQALDKKTNDLNDLEIQIQDEKEQHQKDLDELQKKLDDLQEMKSLVDKEEIDLNEISGIRAQLEIDHADTEQELARMKRLLEAQKEELAKVERKKNELDKRKAENENKKKQIEEKTVTNSQRREVLSKAEEEYNVLVDELDEAKRALAEKQAKLAKEQAVVNDYQAKIREINGGEVQPLDEEKQADENQPTEGGNHESEPFAFV
ncbi:hypothetical protein TRFO_29122 [Tritrichomonas foetus]|uniref:Uncharacterized protein n=1 Tax=Tritrichomonas foetus TaxID=1144522 RepID=A0A1J4JWI7_9EUKA|nr:hypothetical protein TRFO_29122 [Tritrichomonas foetus]|eukprot:OHT03513.1 hypothetical protein TRFO_29122 [Tritrichomonas foetus]